MRASPNRRPLAPCASTERGLNGQTIFAEAADSERYLDTLREYKAEYQVKVLAWRDIARDMDARHRTPINFDIALGRDIGDAT